MEKIIQNITENIINEIYNQYDKRLKKQLNADKYNDKKSFLKYAKKRVKERGKIGPSTEFQFIRYVDNEWCVHFCSKNEAINIARSGFKYGTPQVTKIPYGWGRKEGKNGYNYAFLASDICSGGEDTDFTRFWGYNCVIFKCSGVLGFHRGDKNRQVVFWGKSAKNIIPIIEGFDKENGRLCQLLSKDGKVLYKFDLHNFEKVLNWLINNEFQYRKQLY